MFEKKDGIVQLPLIAFIALLAGTGNLGIAGSSDDGIEKIESVNNDQNIQLAVMRQTIENNADNIIAIQKVNEKMLDYIMQICQITAKINDMICT